MVDIGATKAYPIVAFRGLNKRDDENYLPIGETPYAQNFEVVKRTGLAKRAGFTALFDTLPSQYRVDEAFNYNNITNDHQYLLVNYPNIVSISTDTGAQRTLATDMYVTGDPFHIDLPLGQMMIVDGANAPRIISNTAVTTVSWPPVYVSQNRTVLNNSNFTALVNPTVIGMPSFGALFKNRVWLAGDTQNPNRIYTSRLQNYIDFSDNAPAPGKLAIDVSFFVDVPTRSPITAMKIINNEFLVIYCEREIHLLSGDVPPGTAFVGTPFNFSPLNPDVGCLGFRLVAAKGNNDHYFVSNRGVIYQTTLTDNFQQVKPLGLTSKIYPLLENLTNETFTRGRLVNHVRKGELQYWLPSTNQLRYPDQVFVLNYSDAAGTEEGETWSLDTDFPDTFQLQSAFINTSTNDLILVTDNKFLNGNLGTSYDGGAINTIYQISTLDFDTPDNNKEITSVTMYAKSLSGAILYLSHLWDTGASGITSVTVPAFTPSYWGEANWGQDDWTAGAGESFTKVEFTIPNRIGKIFKSRILHSSATEDLIIHSIIFRVATLGT